MSDTQAATLRTVRSPKVLRHRGRVELGAAVFLAVLGGGISLFAASRQWWVEQVPRPAPLPSLREATRGTDVAPWSAAMGLVSLAGAAALLATRRLGRLVVGLLLLVAGAATILAGVLGLSDEGSSGALRVDVTLAWPMVIIVAGAFGAASGMLTCLRFRRWSLQSTGLTSRYEAPSRQRPTEGEAGTCLEPSSLWDALDRGLDPTQDPTQPPPAGRSTEVK